MGRRIECSVALLAYLLSVKMGLDKEMTDFMPHEDQPEASLNDVMKLLGGVPRG